MSAGENWTKLVTVGTVAAGYYDIMVGIRAKGPATDRGSYLVDQATREAWVFVDENGGRMTSEFDASLFPERISPVAGPFREKPKYSPPSSAASGGEESGDGDDDPVYVELVYLDSANIVRPARGAYASANKLTCGEDDEGSSGSEGHMVPANGIVAFSCPGTNEYWAGTASLPSTSDVGGAGFLGHWSATRSDCGDTLRYNGTRHTYLPWDYLQDVIPRIDSRTVSSRSVVNFVVNLNRAGSRYLSGPDHIEFGRTFDHAWTSAHEYAHALQEESFGGIWTAENCDPHRVWGNSSYSCALQEGFADYLGNVGAPDDLLHGDWEDIPSNRSPSPMKDGSVAAMFHDLIDSANEDDDETTYGGSYVFRVFDTCRVTEIIGVVPVTRDISEIHDMVWCLERTVEDDVHEDHFPNSRTPHSVSEGASEPSSWSASDIRSTWLQNLVP
jgi:hypothetical protein